MSDKRWLTTELAATAGVTDDYVRQDIRAGRLKAERFGRVWAIADQDAQAWLVKRGKRKKRQENVTETE